MAKGHATQPSDAGRQGQAEPVAEPAPGPAPDVAAQRKCGNGS